MSDYHGYSVHQLNAIFDGMLAELEAKPSGERKHTMSLIEIKIIPQLMNDEFDARMDEAHRQQRVAQEAPNLLKALKGLLAEPDSVAWKLLAELYVRNAEGR